MEYVRPNIEIISFVVREHLATSEDTTDNEVSLNGTDGMSFTEAVEPWSL